MNLLAWFQFNVGEGAFYAVFGLLFVVLGITLLVLIFTALGAIMKKVGAKKGKAKSAPAPAAKPEIEEGIPPEVVAAIMAAVTAYYSEEPRKCEFVVRRIKKS